MKWQIINTITPSLVALRKKVAKFKDATVEILPDGLLPHKPDPQDYEYVGGDAKVDYEPAMDPVGKMWRYLQTPFNICVFASGALALSWQNGVRFSVMWMVKLAFREGYIKGNGYSWLRAFQDLAHKYGPLPTFYMKDKILTKNFWSFAAWSPEYDELLKISANFKTTYRKINSKRELDDALASGKVAMTGCPWWTGMNNMWGVMGVLRAIGRLIGGHAYAVTSKREDGRYNMVNSFGRRWGKDGMAIDPGLFERDDYAIYVTDFMPVETLVNHVLKEFDGQTVKGTGSTIYKLENGKKRAFTTEPQFLAWLNKNEQNTFNPLRDRLLHAIPEGNPMPYGQEV